MMDIWVYGMNVSMGMNVGMGMIMNMGVFYFYLFGFFLGYG